MTAGTETGVCRFCGEAVTPVPGGWVDKDGWDQCADAADQFHEPAGPPAPNDEILNRYITKEASHA